MPLFVDHEERRTQILDAAASVIAERGLGQFSLRAVGKAMGGSISLVTHYFDTRDLVLSALVQRMHADVEAVSRDLAAACDPRERVYLAMTHLIPGTDRARVNERVRLALVAHDDSLRAEAAALETRRRELIRSAFAEAVPSSQLERSVDLVQLWTRGLAVVASELPDEWTSTRQLSAANQLLELMQLSSPPRGGRS